MGNFVKPASKRILKRGHLQACCSDSDCLQMAHTVQAYGFGFAPPVQLGEQGSPDQMQRDGLT
jgi:hypothetical protein